MPAPALKQLVWLKYRFIGDAVMATPLLHSVHNSGSEVCILASKHLVELLANEPYAGSVEPTGKVKGVGPFFRQIQELRKARYDRVFLVNRSIRSALIARFAGIRERVGHTTERRGALLSHRVAYDVKKFEAACYGDLCRAVGVDCDDSRVFLKPAVEPTRTNKIGVQPGSTALHKAIPPDHLALLVKAARDSGRQIVLLGGKDERSYGDSLLALTGSEGIDDQIGKCSLQETMSIIAGLERLFCGDTGLIHIGAGVGTPTVSVFASTPASKWGHHYAPHRVIDVGSDQIDKLNPLLLVQALEGK